MPVLSIIGSDSATLLLHTHNGGLPRSGIEKFPVAMACGVLVMLPLMPRPSRRRSGGHQKEGAGAST